MDITSFALGMGISVTHVDIESGTVTHLEPATIEPEEATE